MDRKKILVFALIFLLLSIVQAIVLNPHLRYGLFADDVEILAHFKQMDPSPISYFSQEWKQFGPHHTSPVYYTGFLRSIFGFNYLAYQITILIFKILATISLFMLLLIVFKKYLLAATVAFIYSIHYGSVGAMEMVARSQDYLLVAGLCLFFIVYYLISTNRLKGVKGSVLAMLILLFSFALSPIRAYPILGFVLLIELFFLLKNHSVAALIVSIKKLAVIYAPYFLIIILSPKIATGEFLINTPTIYKGILNGNLHLLITPITSLGSLFLTGDYYRYFGIVEDWNSFSAYLKFIMGGPLIIYGLISLFLAFLISKKPLIFFLTTFFLNLAGELLLFLMVNNHLHIDPLLRMHYDAVTFAPPAVLGFFLLSLSISLIIEWRRQGSRSNLLLLPPIGIFFTLVFWFSTWVFADFVYIPTGINGYTTLPTVGVSIAIGSLVYLAYRKLTKFGAVVFLLLIPFFIMSNLEIQTFFNYNLNQGMDATDQVRLKNKFWKLVGEIDTKKPSLFYFDNAKDYSNGRFYAVIMLDRFDYWMYLYNPKLKGLYNLPLWIVNNEKVLMDSAAIKNGQKGFVYQYSCNVAAAIFSKSLCGITFYDLDHFYAFRLHKREITDIKSELIQRIDFNR